MPNESATEQEYFERLKMPILTISKIKDLLKNDILSTLKAWDKGRTDIERQCMRIVGPAGVGKTQICEQIAAELSDELKVDFQLLMIKAPVVSRDEFIIPFPITENGQARFKMLYSDFIPRDPESYGLFVIDEFSRGDHPLQQLLWQIQNEYMVHLNKFPKKWFVVSIDNPDDGAYQVDVMEDAAGLRRQLHIYTEVNAMDFLKYGISQNFHPTVIEFIQAHSDYLYDFESQKMGSIYANPASYEKLSGHMWKLEITEQLDNLNLIEILASGLINIHMARLFVEFLRDGKDIKPSDIVSDYSEKVREKILTFLKDNDNASLGAVMTSYTHYLTTSMPRLSDKEKENIAQFMVDMPLDTAALFITSINNGIERDSKEFIYVQELHEDLIQTSKLYREEFYDKLMECSDRNK